MPADANHLSEMHHETAYHSALPSDRLYADAHPSDPRSIAAARACARAADGANAVVDVQFGTCQIVSNSDVPGSIRSIYRTPDGKVGQLIDTVPLPGSGGASQMADDFARIGNSNRWNMYLGGNGKPESMVVNNLDLSADGHVIKFDKIASGKVAHVEIGSESASLSDPMTHRNMHFLKDGSVSQDPTAHEASLGYRTTTVGADGTITIIGLQGQRLELRPDRSATMTFADGTTKDTIFTREEMPFLGTLRAGNRLIGALVEFPGHHYTVHAVRGVPTDKQLEFEPRPNPPAAGS